MLAAASPVYHDGEVEEGHIAKGLRLSSAGMLSGTPKQQFGPRFKLDHDRGNMTVATLNRNDRKTKTTAEASIPLTIESIRS